MLFLIRLVVLQVFLTIGRWGLFFRNWIVRGSAGYPEPISPYCFSSCFMALSLSVFAIIEAAAQAV